MIKEVRDGRARYTTGPVLIDTFVETPRYTSAVLRDSGWVLFGATPNARALRHGKTEPIAEKHSALPPAQGLEAHLQPLESARILNRHATTERLH